MNVDPRFMGGELMRILARRLEKLEAKLTPPTPEPIDRLLSQVNTALTAREKVLIKEAGVIEQQRAGERDQSGTSHRT
jgi:hypothetical protein